MAGGRWTISKTVARDALHRAGYPQDRIDEILSGLPDPFDADEAADHLASYGITRDRLMSAMGGSP